MNDSVLPHVCLCMRVSEVEIKKALDAGAQSFEELQDALYVATGCRSCVPAIERLLQEKKKHKVENI